MREIAESIELAGTLPHLDILTDEYVRLLGYPRGWVLEGRARELRRWAEERLSMKTNQDGPPDVVFRHEGTTCTNMGRPLAFNYNVKLGLRAEGYPVLEQHCVPAEGDTGHTAMCQYLEDSAGLMAAIDREKPPHGERLNAVLLWRRKPSAAGCYCESASREH